MRSVQKFCTMFMQQMFIRMETGEDEQGRVLHTMFDQVIIEKVSFK